MSTKTKKAAGCVNTQSASKLICASYITPLAAHVRLIDDGPQILGGCFDVHLQKQNFMEVFDE
jgi:hypothetical protein